MADITIDIEALTLGEVEELEEETGVRVGQIDPRTMPARVLTALVWIVKKRDDPSFTMGDARKLPLSVLSAAANGAKASRRRPPKAAS